MKCAASSDRTAPANLTLFNLISGVYQPEPGGSVVFAGEDITNWEAHEIARQGVARTFQLLRIFAGMSVLENMLIGTSQPDPVRFGSSGPGLPKGVVG